jgi:uncharacterized C2H2 Zn-finger protein
MKRDIHDFIDNEEGNIINTNELIKEADEKAKSEKRTQKEELAKQAKLELEEQLTKQAKLEPEKQSEKIEEFDEQAKSEIQLNKQSKITELYKKENKIKLKNKQIITNLNLENILKPEIFCERCGLDFKTRKTLIRHLEKDVECVCLFSDVTRQELLDNMGKKTGVTCVYCNKIYKNVETVRRHKCINKPNPLIKKIEILRNELNVIKI